MIHIAFSADEKFVPHMGVAMTSILVNSSEREELFFHVISDSISAGSYEKILSLREIKDFGLEIVDAGDRNRDRIETMKKVARNSFLSASETYFRLFIGSIFPEFERILYLDSDIVVLGSLLGIWGTDLSSHTLGVVEEPEVPDPPDLSLGIPHYFNSGVMLFNLARWRSNGYEERCLEVEDQLLGKIQYADQSLLNHVFRDGDTVNLGIQYNYMVCLEKYFRERDFSRSHPCDPVIVHYCGLKPWDMSRDIFSYGVSQPPLFSHYWKYRSVSPWRDDSLKGDIRMREILRYLARHPKDIALVLGFLNKLRKGIYPTC